MTQPRETAVRNPDLKSAGGVRKNGPKGAPAETDSGDYVTKGKGGKARGAVNEAPAMVILGDARAS